VNEEAGGDLVLGEAIALEQAKERDLSTTPIPSAPRISWDQARKLIRLGAVRVAAQHHDLTVLLITRSGKAFSTLEPRLDDVWEAVATVDPCGVYTIKVTE